jgi:thiamine monophosphate kinase
MPTLASGSSINIYENKRPLGASKRPNPPESPIIEITPHFKRIRRNKAMAQMAIDISDGLLDGPCGKNR